MTHVDKDAVRAAHPLERLIPELLGGHPIDAGGEVKVRCPFHPDTRPSLRINIAKQVWRCDPCDAGGDVFAFVQRHQQLQFSEAIQFLAQRGGAAPSPAPRRRPPPDRAHLYHTKSGEPAYQVLIRRRPDGEKEVWQARANGRGGFVSHTRCMSGVELQIFRRHALQGTRDVVIVEGEKDAEALWARGIPATCNTGGAGKWTDACAAQLVDAGAERVRILGDNDDAGRRHVAQVAASCQRAGLQVGLADLPDLPEKGDVSDYLATHATADLLAVLAAATPDGAGAEPVGTAAPLKPLAAALDAACAFIRRFVWLTPEQVTLVAAWAAMTHALEAFDFVAYIHVTSPLPECGKTRLLEVLEPVVAKPWFTARVSAAVLMRKVDKECPTLLLDESDAAFGGADEQYSEALRGLLNAGFQRNGHASVCVGQGTNIQPRDFSVFCPKVIAGIGRLPSTVESRSIPVVMKRRTRGEAIDKFRRRDVKQEAGVLRDQLVAAVADHLEALRASRPTMPAGLSDRAEDVLEPLFAIAALAGGEWPQAVSDATVALMGASARAIREADQNLPLELLGDIRQVFTARGTPAAIATKVLLDGLVALDDRPWGAFGKSEKPITGNRLARMLKRFEIQPAGTIREGDETFKGYRLAPFTDAFARYLGSEASHGHNPNETGAESSKTEASHEPAVTVAKTADHPDKHWVCDAVTVATGDQGEDGPPDLSLSERIWRQADARFKAGFTS